METMQAEYVADGQQLMTSTDIVCKVLCVSQGKADSQGSGNNLFLKNAGIQNISSRVETSIEITLWEQLAAGQESNAALVELLDELRRKTKKADGEFEEFKKRQEEEYNRLCEQVMRLGFPGNSQSSTPVA